MFACTSKLAILLLHMTLVAKLDSSVEDRLRTLERTVERQGQIIEELKAENNDLKARMNEFEDKVLNSDTIKDKLVGNSEREYDVRNTSLPDGKVLRNIVSGYIHDVAFHTVLTRQTCVSSHELLVFDREELDVGDHYNNGDGIFTVPVSGVYVFTWSYISHGDEWFTTEILINGVIRGSNLASSGFMTSTGLIVTWVNSGDHVFVRKGAEGGACPIDHQYGSPTFSGWKLF